MPLGRHGHYERHWGNVPPAQLGLDPAVGRVLTDPGGDVNALWIDPPWATETELADAVFTAYQAIGMVPPEDAACQTLADWLGNDGGVATVQAVGGAYGAPLVGPGANSIRVRTTTDAQGAIIDADILYPFKAGRTYASVTAIMVNDDPGGTDIFKWIVQFPNGDQSFQTFATADVGVWRYLVHYHVPSVDSAIVDIGLSWYRDAGDVGGTADLYIGYAQIVEMPNPQATLAQVEGVAGTFISYHDHKVILTEPTAEASLSTLGATAEVGVRTIAGTGDAFLTGNGATSGVEVFEDFVYSWAEHGAGDLPELGHEFDVGEDYVPVFLSEKDATTAQLYAGSGNVLELVRTSIDGGSP